METHISYAQLKDHYKHCIRLSTSNKINPKNAFDLLLIDYMQDLVSHTEDGQMNFKIASSALDVGAKIYSNRVDCIQYEAQKVASSILMALDGQSHNNAHQTNPDDTQVDPNATATSNQLDDSPQVAKKQKLHKNRNVKTIVEDASQLDAKLEKLVLGDVFLDGLSRDYDMSCPAALICFNALTQPNCLLTIEANNSRVNYQDINPIDSMKPPEEIPPPHSPQEEQGRQTHETNEADSSNDDTTATATNSNTNHTNDQQASSTTNTTSLEPVSLITKNVNCAQIVRNNVHNKICQRLENFLFNDRTTRVETQEDKQQDAEASFNPDLYGGDSNCGDDNPPDIDDDPIPDLDKIVATKPNDYAYVHRLANTWAGPHAWKSVKDGPKGTAKKPRAKRIKLDHKPIDFKIEHQENSEQIADKDIRHSSDVLRRWRKPQLPQGHDLTPDLIRQTVELAFLAKGEFDKQKLTNGHGVAMNGVGGDINDDDMQDDCDPFPDDPCDNPTTDFQADNLQTDDRPFNESDDFEAEFAGEDLIEEPFTVAQVNIKFAKTAKRIDVRRLKTVMWDMLAAPKTPDTSTPGLNTTPGPDGGADTTVIAAPGEDATRTPTPATTSTPATTPGPTASAFTQIYNELPSKVSSKTADDLSQPIAFVTLLHLANERNLRLTPRPDYKDFFIEQDDLVC